MIEHSLFRNIAAALLLTTLIACQSETESITPPTEPVATSEPPVVEVRTTDYSFVAPAELRSGWTTFRMANEGEEPHFLVLWKLPDGKSYDDFVKEVYQPFVDLFGKYKAGTIDRDTLLADLGPALPEWLDMKAMGQGGVGLVSPGRTAQSTVDLPAGNYVMECYMIDAKGAAHNTLGMLRPLRVTEESTGAEPPNSSTVLTVTNGGVDVEGALTSGKQTVRVVVAEAPEGFLGHDLHLARLSDDTSIERITEWMSWIDGLNPPAPAEFLGGAEQVPAGEASYVTVDLEPGRYAWISEGYAAQGVHHAFEVE